MHIFREFKEFALKGNVVDLAVGVIIGGAFGKIISSLVNDILTPFLSVFTGGINFVEKKMPFYGATINYGIFLQNVIDFLIIAFVIFLMVKTMNKIRRKQEEDQRSNEERLLAEIRDILKDQSRTGT